MLAEEVLGTSIPASPPPVGHHAVCSPLTPHAPYPGWQQLSGVGTCRLPELERPRRTGGFRIPSSLLLCRDRGGFGGGTGAGVGLSAAISGAAVGSVGSRCCKSAKWLLQVHAILVPRWATSPPLPKMGSSNSEGHPVGQEPGWDGTPRLRTAVFGAGDALPAPRCGAGSSLVLAEGPQPQPRVFSCRSSPAMGSATPSTRGRTGSPGSSP